MSDTLALSSAGYYRQLREAGMGTESAERQVCEQYSHRAGEMRTVVLVDLLRQVEANLSPASEVSNHQERN